MSSGPRIFRRLISRPKTRAPRILCVALVLLPLLSPLLRGSARGKATDFPTPAPAASLDSATGATGVKVITRREGEVTHVFVQNPELCEVTMTFCVHTVNLRGGVAFPYTATFPPRQDTEAFTLSPEDADDSWQFSYTNYYKLGSHRAAHDDAYIYSLPYAPGTSRKVTQGYNGSFSHKGSNQYAIDWKMPEGTRVCAARGGLVVKVKADSDRGGSGIKYDHFNNYVLIRHDDGTLGHYCHLKKGGVKVKVGQTVKPGDWIALSGNTGFSSGPHLHFCVFKTKDGRERLSIPVKFRNASGEPVTLVNGRNYKAPAVQNTTASRLPFNESAGFGQ
jgi:murein DD-endopeptidase MepM/ murein hydrolase activator NlpD